jgi:hypothetical protein
MQNRLPIRSASQFTIRTPSMPPNPLADWIKFLSFSLLSQYSFSFEVREDGLAGVQISMMEQA